MTVDVKKANGSGRAITDTATAPIAYRIPNVDLDSYRVDPDVVALVPRALCEEHLVLPVSQSKGALIVAFADPTNAAAIEALEAHTGLKIEPVIATEAAIRAAIARLFAAKP